MKTLMIGMDGVQLSTFKRGWTPFIESLIEKGSALSLHEDLLNRGWSEILFGAAVTKTGGFYERPCLDGTYQWTDSFKLSDIPELGSEVKPLWQILNERGLRVGFMNVPTTNPAPVVNGFFVAGGGGGRGVAKEVMETQCYPHSLAKTLNEWGYILDARSNIFWEQGTEDPVAPFRYLQEMTERRTFAFTQLANKHSVDFGFVVYRATVMAETLVLPELYRKDNVAGIENIPLLNAVEGFYRELDRQVSELVGAFPHAEIILVSDHGMAARQWDVDLNQFLIKAGFQCRSGKRSFAGKAIRNLKSKLPIGVRRLIKQNEFAKSKFNSLVEFDPQKSVAFNISRSGAARGFYINDKERFGGPVDAKSFDALRTEITNMFNADPISQANGLLAHVPERVTTDPYAYAYPDIWVELPDGYTPVNGCSGFVNEYASLLQASDLRKIASDVRVSVKAHVPLAVICKGKWNITQGEHLGDLRAIYQHLDSWSRGK